MAEMVGEFKLLPERDQRTLQLHVDAPNGLEDLADEMTEVVLRCIEIAGGSDPQVLRAGLREALHKHIVAGEACGLSSFCWGMPIMDPWEK